MQGKTAERARYIELTRQGMNNSEICRLLGIGRKTGSKWRNGWRVRDPWNGKVYTYPPITLIRDAPISNRYLSEDERIAIADRRRQGQSLRQIAISLNRSPATISREVRRNTNHDGKYLPFRAHKLARVRRLRSRPGKIAANPVLRRQIQQLLGRRWSPDQIRRHLRVSFPDDPGMRVVHETIYRDLYDWRGGSLTRGGTRALRTGRNRRKPSRMVPRKRARFAGEVLMIRDRPFAPADRSVPGHWEGDLIMGRSNQTAIGTLVERTTRFVVLVPIDIQNRTESLLRNLTKAMNVLPPDLRRTLTWDQGWEMSRHTEFTAATGTNVYFCDPRSPWQRGSNEHMNGLLRQYFPKGSDFSVHKPKRLQIVANEINTRPRRILGWDTPYDRFTKLMNEYVQS